MKTRILSLDLARGFTVLFIAPIHCMLLYSKPEVRETGLGNVFRFIAEGPGASLLMLLMGISFVLSPKMKFIKAFQRTFMLLFIAYFLNAWKFVLPKVLNLMPSKLLEELQIVHGTKGLKQLFLIGDILHFAALSFVILYHLSKVFKGHIVQFSLAVVICFVSPLLQDLNYHNGIINYFLVLAGGQPPHAFFPMFPWLVYPLIGYVIGSFIKDGSLLLPLLPIGIAFICIGKLISEFFFPCTELSFYRTCPGHTIFHMGIVLAWLGAWELIATRIPKNYFFDLLGWMSKHITLIYFIQWVIIFWLVPIIGYQTLGFGLTILTIVLVEVNVIGFTFLINELRKK